MRGAGIHAFGGQVRMLELAAPSPAPDEVVISVQAAGVGNWDEFVRVGDWDVGRQPPLALGVERGQPEYAGNRQQEVMSCPGQDIRFSRGAVRELCGRRAVGVGLRERGAEKPEGPVLSQRPGLQEEDGHRVADLHGGQQFGDEAGLDVLELQ